MEEEVREILREAALRASIAVNIQLGTRLAERFQTHSLDREIEELKGQPAQPADLKP